MMRTCFKLELVIVILIFLISCKYTREETSWQENLHKITMLNCQATEFRKARFALADSMRFYQDSLLDFGAENSEKTDFWKARLAVMEVRKKTLTDNSRNLADSIRVELQRLTGHLTVEEKRVFNDSLQARMAECE